MADPPCWLQQGYITATLASHYAAFAQSGYIIAGPAEFPEHLRGVLLQFSGRAAHWQRCAIDVERGTKKRRVAVAWMRYRHDRLLIDHLQVGEYLVEVLH